MASFFAGAFKSCAIGHRLFSFTDSLLRFFFNEGIQHSFWCFISLIIVIQFDYSGLTLLNKLQQDSQRWDLGSKILWYRLVFGSTYPTFSFIFLDIFL